MDGFRDRVEQIEGIFERIGAGVASRANRDGLRERRGERAKQRAHRERGTGRNVEFGERKIGGEEVVNEMLWNRLEKRVEEKKRKGSECGEEGEGGKEAASENE